MNKQALADLKFGVIAIKKKLATREQINKALGIQRQVYEQNDKYILVGDILVQSGVITKVQQEAICAIQETNSQSAAARQKSPEAARERNKEKFMERQFGMIAVKKGFTTREQIDRALFLQKTVARDHIHVLIGDILVKTGAITKAQHEEILGVQGSGGLPEIDAVDSPETAPGSRAVEPVAARFRVTVSDDKMEAHIWPEGNTLSGASVDTIKQLLALKGITYGVLDDNTLAEHFDGSISGHQSLKVAEGKAPEAGRDGRVVYHFDGENDSAGKPEGEDAVRRQHRQVKKGDLIAEKIPPVEGTPGIDIYGNPVLPYPPADVVLTAGDGTELSSDGNRITASDDGYAEVSPFGSISVYPCLTISGDAGHENGDIEFDGHIEIQGSVKDGIHLKGRSLRANEIYNSRIDMSGDVHVTKGISDAEIKVMGTLSATHTNKAKIEALGDVTIENEIIHSDIQTNGACIISKGFIRTSKVGAGKGIIAKDVGSEISGPCTLNVGVDYQAQRESARIKERTVTAHSRQKDLEQLVDDLEKEGTLLDDKITQKAGEEGPLRIEQVALQKQFEAFDDANDGEEKKKAEESLKELDLKLSEIGDQVAELFEEQEQVSGKLSGHRDELEKIDQEIEELKSEADRIGEKAEMVKKDAVIEILGTIFRNNIVSGPHAKLVIPERHRGVRIKEGLTADSKSSVSWFMKISNI